MLSPQMLTNTARAAASSSQQSFLQPSRQIPTSLPRLRLSTGPAHPHWPPWVAHTDTHTCAHTHTHTCAVRSLVTLRLNPAEIEWRKKKKELQEEDEFEDLTEEAKTLQEQELEKVCDRRPLFPDSHFN